MSDALVCESIFEWEKREAELPRTLTCIIGLMVETRVVRTARQLSCVINCCIQYKLATNRFV